LLRAASSFIKAKGSEGTVLGEMLRDMGCINIADSDQSLLENLGVESMIQKEPYHIFVVTMGNDPQAAEQSFEKWMKENPAWGTLTAVREGRVHWMDRSLFHNKPNARWAQAYESLYETLTK
jgi:iron complex transport system substrate-binding protein